MLTELKELEKKIAYEEGQISFFFACDLVPMSLSDLGPLKEILVKNKVIAKDDNVSLTMIDDPLTDMGGICREWHLDDEISARLLHIVQKADCYYLVRADGTYSAYGYLWSECRIVYKDNEFILLEFHICD
jgi:hypothetical protein